jgi:lambda family phage tail tape measure protein
MKAVSDDAITGLARAVDVWIESNTAASMAADMFNRTTDAATSFFTDIITGNKSVGDSFRNMANIIISELARIAVQMAIIRPIVQGFQSLLGFGGVVASGTTSAPLGHGGAAVDWGNLLGSAKGNVLGAPALAAYANTIVDKPTVFPFARGVGLMGEAGAEAIMPLERDRRGRLGVSVADGSMAESAAARQSPIVIESNVNLTYAPSQGGDMAEAQRMMVQLERAVTAHTEATVKKVLTHESRPGGLLSQRR